MAGKSALPRSTTPAGASRSPSKRLISKSSDTDGRSHEPTSADRVVSSSDGVADHDGWIEEFLLSFPGQVVLRHDGDGRILWISPGSEAVFGQHRSVLLSTDANERIHDSVPSAYRRALDQNMEALRSERTVTCTFRLAAGDGTRRWVESVFIPVFDDRHELVEIRSLTHDIDRFKRPLEEISARDRHGRKSVEEKLRRSLAAMRQLAARLQSVREEERARISREIHDELGHQLTGLSLNLGWLRDRLGPGSDGLTQQVDYMLSILDSTWGALRRISTELRPAVLDHLGLPAAVQWQCDDFREHSGIALDLELGGMHRNVTPAVATMVFRVLQEALTNVARHSGASHVEVSLRLLDDHLALVVADDGHGFDPAARAESVTCGLFGMEQRAQELQGHFSLESELGQGTRVEIRVPVS